MFLVVAYGLIFVTVAFIVWVTFGAARNDPVAPGCGLTLFARHRPSWTRHGKDGVATPTSATAAITGAGDEADRFFPSRYPFIQGADLPLSQQRMLSFLEETCCALPVHAETVRVLTHPVDFYEELKDRIRSAQRSIVMSALYIGDGPLSTAFVRCLEDKVKSVSEQQRHLPPQDRPPFTVTILLDYNRMQDRRNLATLQQLLMLTHTIESSSFLDEWDDSDNQRGRGEGAAAPPRLTVRVYLFQNPCKWNRLFAPIGRAKEVLGVQHTKIFVFDGEFTLLTGANLSDDYFATRMDRYVTIDANTYVADWFASLVDTIASMSHRVVCRKEYECFLDNAAVERREKAVDAETGVHVAVALEPPRPSLGRVSVHARSDLVILPNELGLDPSTQTASFLRRARELFVAFAATVEKRMDGVASSVSASASGALYDSLLFPTVQFGRAGVYHDDRVVQRMLHLTCAEDHIYLTSPYLNMYAEFVVEVLRGRGRYTFITASVEANGWTGQKGAAGFIPFFYLQLERAFYYLMKTYHCLHRVQIREFSVKGFTFHAKGLWFVSRSKESPAGVPPTAAASPSTQAPYLVAYGSTNYGFRSVHKDIEAEAFLFTTNPALRETLREELAFLLKQSTEVTEERFVRGAKGRFQPVVSLLAQMGQAFL